VLNARWRTFTSFRDRNASTCGATHLGSISSMDHRPVAPPARGKMLWATRRFTLTVQVWEKGMTPKRWLADAPSQQPHRVVPRAGVAFNVHEAGGYPNANQAADAERHPHEQGARDSAGRALHLMFQRQAWVQKLGVII
jgi:hypothetical protein